MSEGFSTTGDTGYEWKRDSCDGTQSAAGLADLCGRASHCTEANIIKQGFQSTGRLALAGEGRLGESDWGNTLGEAGWGR
ncbi:hypothetical protein E2C01_045369 [Portunus trituberculatus]|uniref:Uncharacterized protein n=1 Tax=Portunus trituberculatus TaxID=210409 RepID=A0A5B7FVK8_PORTR|nr:hypothetical protein [Portunus trituberculatus]